jgi:hypothetical protein
VHDRRVDGEPLTFGNAGALFMNAMTWYDHETGSTWSQPWGRAIRGELKGVELFLLPSQVTTWESWMEEHPDTLVMTNDVDRLNFHRQRFRQDFVIGLILADQAKAYRFEDVARERVINDQFGPYPVVLWASDDNFHAYLRTVGDEVLTFRSEGDHLVDVETGTTWDVVRGLALEGPLEGEALQPVPSTTSYDWAWFDFYPDSELYQPAVE